jgi:hypothetical protein
MMDGESDLQTSVDRLPRIGLDVAPDEFVELPDLSLAVENQARLQHALIGGCIQLRLRDTGPALHGSVLANISSHLSGRGEMVWQEADRVNIAFGVFSHTDRAQVELFADRAARMLGASVALASTIGLLASADANFLQS